MLARFVAKLQLASYTVEGEISYELEGVLENVYTWDLFVLNSFAFRKS